MLLYIDDNFRIPTILLSKKLLWILVLTPPPPSSVTVFGPPTRLSSNVQSWCVLVRVCHLHGTQLFLSFYRSDSLAFLKFQLQQR
jgi:hypothetical protein